VKNFFAGLIMVVLFIAVVGGWFWGVPYLATLVFDQSYWFFATIWLSIHLVRNVIGRIVAQNQLKKYQTIHNILGGK
jgi:hypothetical protein